MAARMTAGKGGEYYVPYENRTGCESIVYFTRDLSAEGLEKIYKKVSGVLHGKVAVKLHTGALTLSRDRGFRIFLRKNLRTSTARRSSRQTLSMRVTATQLRSTARHWK